MAILGKNRRSLCGKETTTKNKGKTQNQSQQINLFFYFFAEGDTVVIESTELGEFIMG